MEEQLEALLCGTAAGVAGTAAMTALQGLAQDEDGDEPQSEEEAWEQAPAPAQVAKRVVEGVSGRHVSASRIPLLTTLGHRLYGTSLGAVYGLADDGAQPVRRGVAFGAGVWALSYAELVPLGIYGLGVALAYRGIRRAR